MKTEVQLLVWSSSDLEDAAYGMRELVVAEDSKTKPFVFFKLKFLDSNGLRKFENRAWVLINKND